jgi:hypothetical protein
VKTHFTETSFALDSANFVFVLRAATGKVQSCAVEVIDVATAGKNQPASLATSSPTKIILPSQWRPH